MSKYEIKFKTYGNFFGMQLPDRFSFIDKDRGLSKLLVRSKINKKIEMQKMEKGKPQPLHHAYLISYGGFWLTRKIYFIYDNDTNPCALFWGCEIRLGDGEELFHNWFNDSNLSSDDLLVGRDIIDYLTG